MADLPDRDDREDELTAAIAGVLALYRDDWSAGLGQGALYLGLRDSIAPLLSDAFIVSADANARELEVGVGDVERSSKAWAAVYAGSLAFSTSLAVYRQLAGVKAGLVAAAPSALADYERAREALAQTLIDSPRWKRGAVTSLTAANTAGNEHTATRWLTLNGVLIATYWQTAEDARVCPVCGPLNDTERRLWERVIPQGPPAHPNCRCWLEYSRVTSPLLMN